MKKLFLFAAAITIFSACTPMKRAQTGMARAISGSEVINVGGHEVYCSEGKVCSEVDVLAIWPEDRDGGKVRVVFKNRLDETALIQIRLQIKSPSTGEVFTETLPHNFALPSMQEKSFEMRGINRKGAKVRVLMNTAY